MDRACSRRMYSSSENEPEPRHHEDDALLCTRGILNDGLRQFSAGDWHVAELDSDRAAAGGRFRLDLQLGTSRQNEQVHVPRRRARWPCGAARR